MLKGAFFAFIAVLPANFRAPLHMGKSVLHFARIDRVIIGAKASDDAKASLREISAKLGVACTEAKLSDSEFRVVV